MNLTLKLFKDELPKLSYWSGSYGGQWTSESILVFSPNGNVAPRRYIVGWSDKNTPLTEEALRHGYIGTHPWYYYNNDCAWIYSKEVSDLFGVEE